MTTTGLAVATWYGAPLAARSLRQRSLQRRCATTGTLVLTYDDGPGETLTPAVLDRLKAYDARATFFPNGSRAIEHPELLDRITAEGHEIGCHGHDHVHAWRGWPWRAVRDIRRGYRALQRWVPADGWYRPPFGKMTPATWTAVRRRGAPIGWWTIAAGDVRENPPPVETALHRAERDGGGVVLLHDFDRGEGRIDFVLEATELLLDAARRHGWTVATLGELTRNDHD